MFVILRIKNSTGQETLQEVHISKASKIAQALSRQGVSFRLDGVKHYEPTHTQDTINSHIE